MMNPFETSYTSKKNDKITASNVPWWNHELTKLRSETRKFFNRRKRTKTWEDYKNTLSRYNTKLRKSKRTWKNLCEDTENQSEASRLHRVLAKEPSNLMGLAAGQIINQ